MPDTRAAAATLYNQVPPGKDIKSDVEKKEFKRLTHDAWWHEKLVEWWTSEDKQKRGVTTCMEFVNWYSDNLRYLVGKPKKPLLGSFFLDSVLPSIGMAHAWRTGAGGDHPYPGDILLHQKTHIDICAACDGGTITRFASGQGIVPQYDIIRRCAPEPFVASNYKGWVDIETFYETEPQEKKAVPSWLVGAYWEVSWRSQNYYYWFDTKGNVWWCDREYMSPGSKPQPAQGSGRYTYSVNDFDTKITVYWESGTVEHFTRDFQAAAETMSGDWNWCELLYATRLD